MFAKRRMFWNVRPMPGRDHVVRPGAPEDRRTGRGAAWYHGGRTIAVTRSITSEARA